MAILTISQEMGSGGAEIGMTVATRLGYTYVDNEELLSRAQRYGLAEDRLARLAEDRPSWVERFKGHLRVWEVEDEQCRDLDSLPGRARLVRRVQMDNRHRPPRKLVRD